MLPPRIADLLRRRLRSALPCSVMVTSCPPKERLRRLPERLLSLLDDAGLDGWIVFPREGSPDCIAAEVAAGRAVARTACLFGRIGDRIRRVAIAASYDVTPLAESGLYDEIIAYRAE